jgi:hypothetical protein
VPDDEVIPRRLADRTFHSWADGGSPTSGRMTWPEDGFTLGDEDPATQFYVSHNYGVSRCGTHLAALMQRASDEIPMGYNALLGCQKVTLVRPDGTTTRWREVARRDPRTRRVVIPGEDDVDGGEGADRGQPGGLGYQLEPCESVPNWVHPAYPARYTHGADGLDEALTDAHALAQHRGEPVVVGVVLTWWNWH